MKVKVVLRSSTFKTVEVDVEDEDEAFFMGPNLLESWNYEEDYDEAYTEVFEVIPDETQ